VPVYERLIPDPRDELMGNEWGEDLLDEHNPSYPMGGGRGAAAGFGGGAGDDDFNKALLESLKEHNNHYGGGSIDIEDELVARALEESK
jgi:hypothetical protein